MREKRNVMDGDGERDADRERSGVSRSKKNVRLVDADRAAERGLLPPGARSSRNDSGLGCLFRQRRAERPRRIEDEPTQGGIIACGPACDQLSKISSNARHFSEQLACVDPDPKRLPPVAFRCFPAAAARYASYSAS